MFVLRIYQLSEIQRRNYRFLISDMHGQNKKYGNFVFNSRLNGKCQHKNVKAYAILVYGHGHIGTQNRDTDFLMI